MKQRDIGIYDENGDLAMVIKNAKSYNDASDRFKREFPNHPLVKSQYGFSMKNIR